MSRRAFPDIRPKGLRSRILLWHGLLLTAVLAAFGFTAWRLHWAGELTRIDRGLDEPLSRLHRGLHSRSPRSRDAPGRSTTAPETYDLSEENSARFEEQAWEYLVWNREGRLLARSSPMPATFAMPAAGRVEPFVIQHRTRGIWREAYLFTPPGECFLAAVSLETDREDARELALWLGVLGIGVLGAGLLIDASILRRAIRPIEDIIEVSERISEGRLDMRIPSVAPDDTELGLLVSVLNNTFARLDAAFAQQSRFSADVAHELRTPVSVMIAEAQGILERERDPDDYRESISTTLRSARRMSGLIESLLELARIESGTVGSPEPCDLATLAEESLATLRILAEQQGIRLRHDLRPAPCVADPSQMLQVASNLLANAIQHNVRGGDAHITTGAEEGYSFLRVSNSGPGLGEEDLSRVFERFHRADRSRNRKTGGAGLGLAIVKAIVDAHGGGITITSDPGVETVATVRLPWIVVPD